MKLRLCVVACLAVASITIVSGQSTSPKPVAAAALQKLLPSVEGWTNTPIRANQIVLSPEATYTYASVTMTKDDWRAMVQLSDTAGSSDALTALAMIVICPPDAFTADMPAQTIKRRTVGDVAIAEMWNADQSSGEITAVVANRFVVTVDSPHADSLRMLRDIFAKVDLAAVAALK